jgi:small subunit ribosomal protein S20
VSATASTVRGCGAPSAPSATAIDAGNPDEVKDALRETISLVDKMAGKGIIHRNTAGRYKSRLASRVAKKSSAAA